jgi:hypothetical protein
MGSPVNSVIKIVRSVIKIKNKYNLKEEPPGVGCWKG